MHIYAINEGLAYVVNETLDRAMLKELLYRQYLNDIPEITSSQALIRPNLPMEFMVQTIKSP